jgi:hypothetical protein
MIFHFLHLLQRYSYFDGAMLTFLLYKEIIISGRTKHFLNVVGEQLSVHQMNNAIQRLEEKFNLHISEFTVASIKDGDKNINRWYLGADKIEDTAAIKEYLDQELKETNKNYKVARDQALDDIQVNVVPVTHFYAWSENFKKLGGQTKIPRVMKEEDFEEFENFIKTL